MSNDIIEQMFCLLFWYNNERKWTIQDTVSIVKPRKDAQHYKEGDLVCAKFSQKPYKAAIVRVREDREDLKDDAKKLENLFDTNLGLSPNQIMEQMGVPVPIQMDEDKRTCDDMQKTSAAPKENAPNKSITTKQKMPAKSAENNMPASKRSKSNKEEGLQNKKVNDLKEEKKNQQVASVQAAKIMAKKIAPNKLFQQDAVEDVEFRDVSVETFPPAVSQNSTNSVNVSGGNFAPNGQSYRPESRNVAANTGDHYNEQFHGLPYNQQPYNSTSQVPEVGFSYTNMLSCMSEANSALYGGYPDHVENGICRDPNCHVSCNNKIDVMQQKIDAMQQKIQFLENQLMRGFLDKLAKEVSSSDVNTVNSNSANTPRRPSFQNKATQRMASPAATEIPYNSVSASAANHTNSVSVSAVNSNNSVSPAPARQCGPDTLGDISNSPLLNASQMVELVAGTGVMISTSQLNICERKAKDSGTALARLLLVVFFDSKTLSESCARGSSSSKRKMLDPNVTEAIIQFCLNFKQTKVTEKEIIQAINNKCSDVRQESTKTPKSKKSL